MFIAVLMLNAFGAYVNFFTQRTAARSMAHTAIRTTPRRALQRFTFTTSQYESLAKPEQGEVEINGEMYDVQQAHFTVTGVELLAYRDNWETEVINKLCDWFTKGDNSKPVKNTVLLKFTAFEFCRPATFITQAPAANTIAIAYHNNSFSLQPATLNHLSPPPDMAA